MTSINLIQLVKRAKKGDEQAFLQLFQQYEKELYRIAYVYMKHSEDASDVIQDVAYQAFKNLKALRKPQYIKTWLTKMTMNSALNLIKKQQKVVPLKNNYESFIEGDSTDIPFEISLQDLIDQLKEEEKSVLLLRFYEGYTFKEIAELLNMPLGTAKSILYRALNKLRAEYLKEEGDT